MPGLNQLKQFNQDMLSVGDEVSIRAKRGEKPVKFPIPKDITIENDSEDFVLGMPEKEAEVEVTPAEEDLSDLIGLTNPQSGNKDAEATPAFEAPDMSSLLNPINISDDASAGAEMPDLSMFMDEEEEEEVVEEEPEEISIADMGLDDLLAGGGFDQPEESDEDLENNDEIDFDAIEDVESLDEIDDLDDAVNDTPATELDPDLAAIFGNDSSSTGTNDNVDLGSDFDSSVLGDFSSPEPSTTESEDDMFLNPDFGVEEGVDGDLMPGVPDGLFDSGDMELPDAQADDVALDLENLAADADFDMTSTLSGEESSEPEPVEEIDEPASEFAEPASEIDEPVEDFSDALDDLDNDFNLPDDMGEVNDLGDLGNLDDLGDLDGLDAAATDETPAENSDLSELGDFDDLGGDYSIPDTDAEETSTELNDSGDFSDLGNLDDMDFGNSSSIMDEADAFDVGNDFDNDTFDDAVSDESVEVFDTSDMDGLNFDVPETDSQMNGDSDFELGNGDDFAMEGDFEIPGFSDVDTVKEEKSSKKASTGKNKKGKKSKDDDLDIPDFTDAKESEELPPNTLSDEQYKEFLKNLGEYPLNVRLAVEDLLVNDEFTEDAEFEVVEKILNKVPARQLASTLEKMLDTSIPVPRDFEHRTAEEYEAYKKSLSYQLRNKIIPGAIACVALMLVAWGLFNFTKNCIYKPLKANSLYKQGYNLLTQNEYPQSEMKFTEATKYRLSKNWFFEYARGYRTHKQYQRAGTMYQNILYCFKHDKTAGLEYAAMELEDLANYELAEDIVRRQVLDYHINDADGMLLLGDIFLEWGTEKDPEKLELARQQYATLLQLYGSSDLYLSRMMRYFVRSDNLRQVLQLKSNFEKEKQLSPDDWTELSGYLLDKYYGPLSHSEEYLRYEIEGLRGLLIRAAKTNEDSPIALYNLGRYYILSNEQGGVESTLQKALKNFNSAESLRRRDIYKYIDTYRLLGEHYIGTSDYLQAQEQFSEGISLYTTERDNAGFEGNTNIGKLYEDLANIKYFIAGDYDEALLNYTNSVDLGNDTSSIRYKIGYIQYQNKNYLEALGSFMKAGEGNIKEENLMLAMANTLSLRGDDYAAQGYYERLINKMDLELADKGIVFPQKNVSDNDLVTSYMYAANNYGVSLYRLAKRTGDSGLNAQAIVQFQQSIRAWDALTRNQETLVRLPGSNLAEQNVQYITHKIPDFEPSIYVNISNTLTDKEHL